MLDYWLTVVRQFPLNWGSPSSQESHTMVTIEGAAATALALWRKQWPLQLGCSRWAWDLTVALSKVWTLWSFIPILFHVTIFRLISGDWTFSQQKLQCVCGEVGESDSERWPGFSKRNLSLSPGHLSCLWFGCTSSSIVLTVLELSTFPQSWVLRAPLRELDMNISWPHPSSLCLLGCHRMNSGLREEHTVFYWGHSCSF